MNDTTFYRCPWCETTEKMIRYHDEEWGLPLHNDQKQFEFLMMEGHIFPAPWDHEW